MFTWWDDAVAWARAHAAGTLLRQKVFAVPGGWAVDLADAEQTTPAEVCS